MENLIGQKFNRLKVIADFPNPKYGNKRTYWLCKCDCGKEKVVRGDSLKAGNIMSCGCLHSEISSVVCKKNMTTHGKSRTRTLFRYRNMVNRCNRKEDISYKRYGGRGIKCLWRSFEDFYRDMGEPPTSKYTLDRIDNNGNYCKENCRWATMEEQSNNRRDNHLITFEGKTLTMATWAKIKGLKISTLAMRLSYYKWSVEKSLTLRPREGYKVINL